MQPLVPSATICSKSNQIESRAEWTQAADAFYVRRTTNGERLSTWQTSDQWWNCTTITMEHSCLVLNTKVLEMVLTVWCNLYNIAHTGFHSNDPTVTVLTIFCYCVGNAPPYLVIPNSLTSKKKKKNSTAQFQTFWNLHQDGELSHKGSLHSDLNGINSMGIWWHFNNGSAVTLTKRKVFITFAWQLQLRSPPRIVRRSAASLEPAEQFTLSESSSQFEEMTFSSSQLPAPEMCTRAQMHYG